MPSITPSYLYTFAALVTVNSLLLFAFISYTNTLRVISETRQLEDLLDYVAAESTRLLTIALTTNATVETHLQMPTAIGDKHYWLELCNDSTKAWLEGGLGNVPIEGTERRVYLPEEAVATGYYLGGYGAAHLRCYLTSGVPQIQLTDSSSGE